MSIWRKFKEFIDIDGRNNAIGRKGLSISDNPFLYAFVDVEVGLSDKRVHDIGALRYDNAIFHSASKKELFEFLNKVDYLCGHNIIHHDVKFLFGNYNYEYRWRLVV